jgi:hypothetical protein
MDIDSPNYFLLAPVFDSVEQMCSPTGLARLLGGEVEAVELSPLDAEHYSGNSLERVRVRRGARQSAETTRFVLKRFSPERDWIMRLTHDDEVREVALFRGGVYQRLPEQCFVPVVAAARDGSSWASLMVDVSGSLARLDLAPIPPKDLRRYLDHLAAAHARFMGDESLLDPALGLSSLEDFILILSAPTVRREIEQGRGHRVLEMAARGWQIFEEAAEPEAVRIIQQAQQDPGPLLSALARAPRTLVHGDYKLANLGTWPPPQPLPRETGEGLRTIMLDWQDATFGPPLLDLAYFLALSSARLPVSKEEAIQIYRDALAGHGYTYADEEWMRDLEVGLLAGGAMRLAWQMALGTQSDDLAARARAFEEVRWWSETILRVGRWLG